MQKNIRPLPCSSSFAKRHARLTCSLVNALTTAHCRYHLFASFGTLGANTACGLGFMRRHIGCRSSIVKRFNRLNIVQMLSFKICGIVFITLLFIGITPAFCFSTYYTQKKYFGWKIFRKYYIRLYFKSAGVFLKASGCTVHNILKCTVKCGYARKSAHTCDLINR